MRSKLIILLFAFLLIGLAESEAKSYWQVRFENAKCSSPAYYTGAQGYWCNRRESKRGYKRGYIHGYSRTTISRPRYRGYYGGPWRRYKEFGPHCN